MSTSWFYPDTLWGPSRVPKNKISRKGPQNKEKSGNFEKKGPAKKKPGINPDPHLVHNVSEKNSDIENVVERILII